MALLAVVVVTVLAAVAARQPPRRALLHCRGITAVIPEPADQTANRERNGSAGGRPVGSDARDDKNRNLVERFDRMKSSRGLASRYDKHALVYRGSVVLAAIIDWLR